MIGERSCLSQLHGWLHHRVPVRRHCLRLVRGVLLGCLRDGNRMTANHRIPVRYGSLLCRVILLHRRRLLLRWQGERVLTSQDGRAGVRPSGCWIHTRLRIR